MRVVRSVPYLVLVLVILVLAPACRTVEHRAGKAAQADLVEVITVVPDAVLDIRYATANNFTGRVVYPSARCFLARDAAYALRDVQEELRPLGYRLKIFDGYRPLSVQRQFWKILPDPRYVADPKVGSRHNRGYAVDLSLVDLAGNDVPMPSEFDDFSERAHPDYSDLPRDIIERRAVLTSVMERHGFRQFPTEWWHFDFQGWEDKPVLDIPINAL